MRLLAYSNDPTKNDSEGNNRRKTIEKAIDAIQDNAIDQWIEQEYENIKGNSKMKNVSKQELRKKLKLEAVDTEYGIAALTFDGKSIIEGGTPVVTFDPETGKIIETDIYN